MTSTGVPDYNKPTKSVPANYADLIVGLVIALLVISVVLFVIAVYCCRLRKKSLKKSSREELDSALNIISEHSDKSGDKENVAKNINVNLKATKSSFTPIKDDVIIGDNFVGAERKISSGSKCEEKLYGNAPVDLTRNDADSPRGKQLLDEKGKLQKKTSLKDERAKSAKKAETTNANPAVGANVKIAKSLQEQKKRSGSSKSKTATVGTYIDSHKFMTLDNDKSASQSDKEEYVHLTLPPLVKSNCKEEQMPIEKNATKKCTTPKIAHNKHSSNKAPGSKKTSNNAIAL